MPRRPAPANQMDLLAWEPPAPVARFAAERVRAATLADQLARGISEALGDAAGRGLSREEVAGLMSAYLGGEPVKKSALDGYASQAREGHVITLLRFIGLLHATGDRRLLEMLIEPLGWTVIDRAFLSLIELAALREREDELRKRADALRRRARAEGVL